MNEKFLHNQEGQKDPEHWELRAILAKGRRAIEEIREEGE